MISNNGRIKFSVICPFFNSEKYLSEAIESVIAQSYIDWELILINDGSTDNSIKISEKYLTNDYRIKLFSIKNSGTFAARNFGISHSSGDYVLFLDSDDYLAKDTLEYLQLKIRNTSSQIIYFNIETFSSGNLLKKNIIQVKDEKILFENLSVIKETFLEHEYGYGVCGCCFAKELFKNLRLPYIEGIKSAEDILLAYSLFSNASSVILSPEILYFYRMNENSTTHTMTLKDYWDCTRVFMIIYSDIYKKYHSSIGLKCNNKIFWGCFSFLTHAPMLENSSEFAKQCSLLRKSLYYKKFIKNYHYPSKKTNFAKFLLNLRLYKLLYKYIRKYY